MGFPHSEIFGSKCIGNSPKLIAAYHVLHRLSVPRHPPNALLVLDLTFVSEMTICIVITARSVQGTTPTTRTASLPFLPPHLGDGARKSRLLRPHTSDKRCQRTNSAPSRRFVFYAARSHARCDGGGRRDRTDDLLLAKQALSQLSYAPVLRTRSRSRSRFVTTRAGLSKGRADRATWWAREDLNLRPHAYQARALTS